MFRTSIQGLYESCTSHAKIFISLSDILELLNLQQNVLNLQGLQEFCTSHTEMFTSFSDILKLLQLLNNVQDLQGLLESILHCQKVQKGQKTVKKERLLFTQIKKITKKSICLFRGSNPGLLSDSPLYLPLCHGSRPYNRCIVLC